MLSSHEYFSVEVFSEEKFDFLIFYHIFHNLWCSFYLLAQISSSTQFGLLLCPHTIHKMNPIHNKKYFFTCACSYCETKKTFYNITEILKVCFSFISEKIAHLSETERFFYMLLSYCRSHHGNHATSPSTSFTTLQQRVHRGYFMNNPHRFYNSLCQLPDWCFCAC